MFLSTTTNERSQTLFYVMRSIDMNEFLNCWHFLMAIRQSDSQIEVINIFNTYFFVLSYYLFIVIFVLGSII